MNNNIKQKILAIVAVVIIGAGGFWLYNAGQVSTSDNTAKQVVQTIEKSNKITFSEDQKTVSYDGQTGKTALELLESMTDVTTEDSDFGTFVTGINGVIANANKEYWSFYVNGSYASEGAGTYKTSDGEKIEWKLESL